MAARFPRAALRHAAVGLPARTNRSTERGAVVVRLDPGLAFGTGTHPSTALCLKWLDAAGTPATTSSTTDRARASRRSPRPGSAPPHVAAFDIDPQALLATTENAAANGVATASRPQRCRGRSRQERRAGGQHPRRTPDGAGAPVRGLVPLRRPDPAGRNPRRAGGTVADAYAPWFDIAPWQRDGCGAGWRSGALRRPQNSIACTPSVLNAPCRWP